MNLGESVPWPRGECDGLADAVLREHFRGQRGTWSAESRASSPIARTVRQWRLGVGCTKAQWDELVALVIAAPRLKVSGPRYQPRPIDPEPLLTLEQAAAYAQVSPSSLRNWIAAGRLPAIATLSGGIRVTKASLVRVDSRRGRRARSSPEPSVPVLPDSL